MGLNKERRSIFQKLASYFGMRDCRDSYAHSNRAPGRIPLVSLRPVSGTPRRRGGTLGIFVERLQRAAPSSSRYTRA